MIKKLRLFTTNEMYYDEEPVHKYVSQEEIDATIDNSRHFINIKFKSGRRYAKNHVIYYRIKEMEQKNED